MTERADEGASATRVPWKHPRGLSRWTIVHPGFYCMRADCVRPNAGDHGRHGEEWIYAVTDGECEFALTMIVYTDKIPGPPIGMRWPDEGARGAYLDLHARKPWYDGMEVRKSCTYLGGHDCYSDGSLLYAEEFFKKHGDRNGPTQPESFWKAMEAELRKRIADSFPGNAAEPPSSDSNHADSQGKP